MVEEVITALSRTLHPDKTGLIQFGRRAAEERERAGLSKPETFDFLDFTHICGRSRRVRFLLFRRTRRDRKRAKIESEMFGDRCTQLHISRRRAPMSTGAAGRNGIASAAQCGTAVRRAKSPRTSSGRKRERGAIT